MIDSFGGYWPSPWPGEDAGALRRQSPRQSWRARPFPAADVVTRSAVVATMVVTREPGEVFLLCHSGGDEAVSWVEQLDPETLVTLRKSVDLAAGPTWPGGIAAHANGSLYVVFGRWAHRLNCDLDVVASRELPRDRPYNSFVVLDDGTLVTKDFGGARPGESTEFRQADTQLLAVDPDDLKVISSLTVPEGSIARLSTDGSRVYVVGTESLLRVLWDGHELSLDQNFRVAYRRGDEGYGWDCVLADGSVWFLNNGVGSERYNGSLLGLGQGGVDQAIIRVDDVTGELTRYVVTDKPNGIVANPPAIDASRKVVVGYDSGNGVVTAWKYGGAEPVVAWTKNISHASHPIILDEMGWVVLNDFVPDDGGDFVVVLDIETGDEVVRVASGSPVQSVVFSAAGFNSDLYYCSFLTVARIAFSS